MTPTNPLPAGHRLPGTVYRVIRLLGAGGMGVVYEVEDTTVLKRYVLKTLHGDLQHRKDLAARMGREARILARLAHPNIVEVVTAGVTRGTPPLPYFVMEKLCGHSLRTVLFRRGRLPLETAYSIAIDLLEALDHAHSCGIVHRDVKPDNVFIHRTQAGGIITKLLDFGVMRLVRETESHTGQHFVGTLRYAPPEQLRGEAATPRSDLYAAALVLYEMIAGCGPFDAERSDPAIAQAHLHTPPPSLSWWAPGVPRALDDLVCAALAKDPEKRPTDALTMASELRALWRALVGARSPDPMARTTIEAALAGLGAPQITNAGADLSPTSPTSPASSTPDATDASSDAPTLPGTTALLLSKLPAPAAQTVRIAAPPRPEAGPPKTTPSAHRAIPEPRSPALPLGSLGTALPSADPPSWLEPVAAGKATPRGPSSVPPALTRTRPPMRIVRRRPVLAWALGAASAVSLLVLGAAVTAPRTPHRSARGSQAIARVRAEPAPPPPARAGDAREARAPRASADPHVPGRPPPSARPAPPPLPAARVAASPTGSTYSEAATGAGAAPPRVTPGDLATAAVRSAARPGSGLDP